MVQTRTTLLGIISALPGIRFLQLKRHTGLANGVLAYHLSVLEKESLLRVGRGPGFAEFYPTTFHRADIAVFGAIKHNRSRQILSLLLDCPDMSHGEIAAKLHAGLSTTSWYLGRLTKADTVAVTHSGREARYRLVEPDRVRRLLAVYRSTWKDTMVDEWASIWENTTVLRKPNKNGSIIERPPS